MADGVANIRYEPPRYTHEEYRRAGVAHLIYKEKERKRREFYHRGKLITEEMADRMVEEYFGKRKQKRKNKRENQE